MLDHFSFTGNEEKWGALRFPEWEEPCGDALLEPDAKRLFQQVVGD
jgi:hypothetical protein